MAMSNINNNKAPVNDNLGLLYTRRYYDSLTENVLHDKKSQAEFYERKNRQIVSKSKSFDGQDAIPKAQTFRLKTQYPGLITGIGIQHATGHEGEAKLGLAFDHTTGLPYLPGPSVKGIVRSVFPVRGSSANGERRQYVLDLVKNSGILTLQPDEVDTLELLIFGSDNKNADNHDRGDVVFFDAFPVKANDKLLGLDFITPHTSGQFKDPVPIQFMRIQPGVTFRFSFMVRGSKLKAFVGKHLPNQPSGGNVEPQVNALLKRLFSAILTTIGIGAKTNVGYGQLKEA